MSSQEKMPIFFAPELFIPPKNSTKNLPFKVSNSQPLRQQPLRQQPLRQQPLRQQPHRLPFNIIFYFIEKNKK